MDRETVKISSKFASEVKSNYKGSEVYLFGSRASETNLVTSDFDFIVVSNEFDGVKLEQRIGKIQNLWNYSKDADIICLTEKEFNKKNSILLRLASKKWVKL